MALLNNVTAAAIAVDTEHKSSSAVATAAKETAASVAKSTVELLHKLEKVTYADHPLVGRSNKRSEKNGKGVGGDEGPPTTTSPSSSIPQATGPTPTLNVYSITSLRPMVMCSLALLWQLTKDAVYVLMLTTASMLGPSSCWRIVLVSVAVAGLTYRYLFDWQKGWLVPNVKAGVYCRRTPKNEVLCAQVESLRHPHYTNGTLFCRDGDVRTLMPFLIFKPPSVAYVRRWLKVPTAEGPSPGFYDKNGNVNPIQPVIGEADATVEVEILDTDTAAGGGGGGGGDGVTEEKKGEDEGKESPEEYEAIALDWAFPVGGYDSSKGVVVVLHGLNGGSSEPYVLDLVNEAIDRGVTVCVLVARGLMGTPVYTEALFHGARVTDVETTVSMIRKLIGEGVFLGLVGYSMGAVIASNYVCKAGSGCPLDCCVAIGGSFDTRVNMRFAHSIKVWQPYLAFELKLNFAVPNLPLLMKRGIHPATIERSENVVAFDTDMVAVYHGYKCVEDYYSDMSAGCHGKLSSLARPLLIVHACDDPIMTVTSYPLEKAQENEHIIYLITEHGGHVGWPIGLRPTKKKWTWMTSTALDYMQAVRTVSTGTSTPQS